MFILTLAIMVFHAAEAAETISVSTNNDIYYNGDHVVVFGNVNTLFENIPITIQIYHETNLISVAQVPVAKDGTFVSSFYATGSKWKDEGTYTIRAQYTSTQIAEMTFEFFGQAIDKSSAVFPVDIPNSGTFDLEYTASGFDIKDAELNQDRYSILIEITENSGGNLVLKLPRESFDSKISNGTDEIFIVLVSKDNESGNFIEVQITEIEKTDDYRTISIQIEEEEKFIEVIGTYVIPEFGSIVIMILLVAITSAIVISKNKFSFHLYPKI